MSCLFTSFCCKASFDWTLPSVGNAVILLANVVSLQKWEGESALGSGTLTFSIRRKAMSHFFICKCTGFAVVRTCEILS